MNLFGTFIQPFISKAFRYEPCVTMGSHSFTATHTCLYSPAARRHPPPFGWYSLHLPMTVWQAELT